MSDTLFDVILRNGQLIDGTKRPRFRADLGIRGDRIEAIGSLGGVEGREVIDTAGQIVAPGFIDVHNHSDGWLLNTPHLTSKTLQGFTTEVLMADGISYAPVNAQTAAQWMFYLRGLNGLRMEEYQGWQTWSDYMRLLDGSNVQNVAAHLPYANIRSMACGFASRPVDDFQMQHIKYEIRRGMEAGAVGLSTGLDYIVQCFSTTEELIAACTAMADVGGIYVTHVRYKRGLLPALEEAVEIGRRAGVPVHISHLKSQPTCTHEQVFEFLDRARRDVDLTFDVYPYQPGSTMLNYLLPYEVWEQGPLTAMSLVQRPEVRARFLEGLATYRLDLDHIRIAWLPGKDNTRLQGRTLGDYVAESGKSPEAALLDLLVEERLAVLCVMDEGDDALVWPFLQHELYMMGTDGIYQPRGHVHPRMYGSVGRLLGRCVRELKLFSLEEAVHKLSGFPAERFRLRDRGVIRAGAFADLVVFDPLAIRDEATFADPTRPTRGVNHVLVNGRRIVAAGEPVRPDTDRAPGRFLRAGP